MKTRTLLAAVLGSVLLGPMTGQALAADYHYTTPEGEAANDENCHYWKRQMDATCRPRGPQGPVMRGDQSEIERMPGDYLCDQIKEFMIDCANAGVNPSSQYRRGQDIPTSKEYHEDVGQRYGAMQHQQCLTNCNANSTGPDELSACKAQCP